MSSTERRYVLILDKARDFIRVFRADCEVRPDGLVLWDGDGLHRAYEAMIRLNRERRPVVMYRVISAGSNLRTVTIKVVKGPAPEGWTVLSSHTSYGAALAAAKAADERRVENERRDFDARLKRVGVKRGTKAPPTDKDYKYLEWLEARRQIFADTA